MERKSTVNQTLQIYKVDLQRKKMNSKEAFAEELQSLHVRKKSMISIKEMSDEEAIHITVDELPNQYEDMLALVLDTEDDEEETIEGDLLIAYLQGESMKPEPEKEEEPLNQPIQVDNSEILIRAKTSISQSLAHEAEINKKRSFEDIIPKEYHEYQSVFKKTASEQFPEK